MSVRLRREHAVGFRRQERTVEHFRRLRLGLQVIGFRNQVDRPRQLVVGEIAEAQFGESAPFIKLPSA